MRAAGCSAAAGQTWASAARAQTTNAPFVGPLQALTRSHSHVRRREQASVWYEGNPCNMHLLDIAQVMKKEVQAKEMVRPQSSL